MFQPDSRSSLGNTYGIKYKEEYMKIALYFIQFVWPDDDLLLDRNTLH